jgi:hypothetical protein
VWHTPRIIFFLRRNRVYLIVVRETRRLSGAESRDLQGDGKGGERFLDFASRLLRGSEGVGLLRSCLRQAGGMTVGCFGVMTEGRRWARSFSGYVAP